MTGQAQAPYDLIAIGRCGVDLYPMQVGLGLSLIHI